MYLANVEVVSVAAMTFSCIAPGQDDHISVCHVDLTTSEATRARRLIVICWSGAFITVSLGSYKNNFVEYTPPPLPFTRSGDFPFSFAERMFVTLKNWHLISLPKPTVSSACYASGGLRLLLTSFIALCGACLRVTSKDGVFDLHH